MKNIRKIFVRIALILFFAYIIYLFITQQQLLGTYAREKNEYNKQIEQAEQKNKELNDKLDNLNSTNYIETIARDELDMVYPNDRIYIDTTK